MKRLITGIMTVVMLMSMSGCLREQPKDKTSADYVINEKRTTDGYKYDWIDFVEISVYGADGKAYVQVTPKEITADDFDSDADYIAIKSALDSLNLSYVANGSNTNSKLSVTPDSNLSSGDVVTLSIKQTVDSSLSLNTQEYEFRVPTLSEANAMDLFGENNVIFYGLEGTGEFKYMIADNSMFTDAMKNNLVYTIKSDTTTAEVGKTVLTVSAELSGSFLKEAGFPTTEQYLSMLGYKADSYSTQIVLRNMAKPVNYATVLKEKIINALYDAVYSAEVSSDGKSDLNTICNVQQFDKDASDPYTQYVIYQDVSSDGTTRYYRRAFRAAYLGDKVIILSLNNSENASEEYATSAYTGAQIVLDNAIVEEASAETETPEEAEATEETTEETVEN